MSKTARGWLIPLLVVTALIGTALGDAPANDEPAASPCDNIFVFVSPLWGPTYVFNFTDQAVQFNLQTTQVACSESQCGYTSTRNGVTLASGEVGYYEFVPDTLEVYCLDVYCCGGGSIGQASATVTWPAGQCQASAERVRWDTCFSKRF